MQELIEEAITRKSKAVLRRQRIDHANAHKNAERYGKRTGLLAGAPLTNDPIWWDFHPHFDPKYCIAHARYISRVIWKRLQADLYEPIPAIQFDVPKPDGSSRQVMAFAIPDSAVANVVHRKITRRNLNQFSSYSFAYRPDKNVFDAILYLNRSLGNHKSYIIQYDFSKYFDTISHSYLEKVLFDKKTFLLSASEKNAINAFLTHAYCHVKTYKNNVFDVREAGVPQGSSLSLFLSNAAAHELDLCLERQNGSFVRFADDVVAVTHSYRDALAVASQFRIHCEKAGLLINYAKSPGILLFGGGPDRDRRDFTIDIDDGSELRTDDFIDYLGHRIDASGIGLPAKSIKRIKRQISEIIYKHLFLHRRGIGGAFDSGRVGPGFFDWDLVTCLNEIRRYMYGGLRENHITGFLSEDIRPPFIRGLMAFFPLSTEVAQFKQLDGWLLSVIRRAQRERVRVLAGFGHHVDRLTKMQIVSGSWYTYAALDNEVVLPSFVRGWRTARKYYLRYGLTGIKPPSYYSLINS
ncbi:reverse transcriptase domain-containing protein [Parvibaculum sp.]|uniref:reverse transcriptase domain-containing protein n=1 Tax=Parvibaculum sp. TaxID=2024848 RepID=UPI002C7DD931|nr:reverse transcriptase domain-containing protein [Parvibaculum sp.]HUD53478.1 reverse transcriptase domain-containing protein [Parvibaculum sp.]